MIKNAKFLNCGFSPRLGIHLWQRLHTPGNRVIGTLPKIIIWDLTCKYSWKQKTIQIDYPSALLKYIWHLYCCAHSDFLLLSPFYASLIYFQVFTRILEPCIKSIISFLICLSVIPLLLFYNKIHLITLLYNYYEYNWNITVHKCYHYLFFCRVQML